MSYYDDHRVRAHERGERLRVLPGKMQALYTLRYCEDDTNIEEEITVPIKYEVCPTCNGKGTHVNPSIDCDGISSEDFYEDPDFAESYMEGCYDVGCYQCHGNRVVPALDRDRIDAQILKQIDEAEEDHERYLRESAYERRMGY